MKTMFTLISLMLMSAPSFAGVTVSPVHLNINQKDRSTSLQIQNSEDRSATLDLRVFKWKGQSEDGQDILEKTDAIVLTRPVVVVPPNSSATVRLIASNRSVDAEDTYRLVVEDITPTKQGAGVGVRLNSVLPLFVLNSQSAGSLEMVNNNEFKNTGTRHVRITGYTNLKGEKVSTLRYLMPGQSIKLDVASSDDIVWSDSVF